MTCVNTQTMYGHAKEPTEFDESKRGERVTFPGAHQDWIGPHVVGMEALLNQVQAAGVVVITSSVDI
jgi:hypothetical protein